MHRDIFIKEVMKLEDELAGEDAVRCRLRLMARCTQRVGTERLEYRLCEVRRRNRTVGYAVGARGFGERRTVFVGGDSEVAEKIYLSIVRGKVTPCTLGYVVEDILDG